MTVENIPLFIDGERTEAVGGRTFENKSPIDDATIADVAAAGIADAQRAVSAARRAFDSWSAQSFAQRRAVLLRAADELEAGAPAIATSMALETGGAAAWAHMNISEAAATLREAAALASSPVGEILPSQQPGSINLSLRIPSGVVLAIVPWNAPLVLAARSVAIALAVGNTIILRPSEESPNLAGHVLAEALTKAGAPAGVVNVLTTSTEDAPEVIEFLVSHPFVRRVVFIGSTPVGRHIAEIAGRSLTPAIMELGGKNPTIVLDDADVEATADGLIFGAFANSGQVCMATDIVIATPGIYDALASALVTRTRQLVVGDPRENRTDLGPLINDGAVARFRALVEDATGAGASRLLGSSETQGRYAQPVILENVGSNARLYREEAFSPIMSIHRAENEDAAVQRANDTEFGLIASVVSRDSGRALKLASHIKSGAVHINAPSIGDEPHVPFGGLGMSGFGRLGGSESVRAFTEQRTMYLHGEDLTRHLL